MKKIYISIPITGNKNWELKLQKKADKLRIEQDWVLFNPGEVYNKAIKASISTDELSLLLQDLHLIHNLDGIYFMSGYKKSLGCQVELAFAKFIQRSRPEFEIMFEETK